MNISSLEVLEKSGLLPAQARAILQTMSLEIANREHALATGADLRATEHALETSIEVKFHALELRIESVRTEMQQMGTKLVRWSFLFWVTGVGTLFSLFKWLK